MNLALIPAAGKGMRLRELGKHYPKCLLPLNGRPIICETIEALHPHVDHIFVAIAEDEDSPLWEMLLGYWKVTILRIPHEDTEEGPIGTIRAATRQIVDTVHLPEDEQNTITVVLSDAHYKVAFKPLIGQDVLLCMEVGMDTSRWCMVQQEAIDMCYENKPMRSTSSTALVGVYCFRDLERFVSSLALLDIGGDSEAEISDLLSAYSNSFSLDWIEKHEFIDFGTIEDYLKNRNVSCCREFNNVEFCGDHVRKSSKSSSDKLYREACWMKHGPFRHLCPEVYEMHFDAHHDTTGFTMERLTLPSLRDMMLYHDRSPETWKRVFRELRKFVDVCKFSAVGREGRGSDFWEGILDKNRDRVALCSEMLSHSHRGLLLRVNAEILKISEHRRTSLYHGDLHPANIFWDDTGRIRFVDPRGDLYGHWLYDVAKLYHSFIGRYDLIDAELYTVKADGSVVFYEKGLEPIRELFVTDFLDMIVPEPETQKFVRNLAASLFITMVPLHKHNKTNQQLFLEEAERLTLPI